MTDLVTFGEALLRYAPPRGDRLETARTLEATVTGAESNVAAAAANLGLDAVWLSKLPDSPLGRRIVRELRGHGIRTGIVWTDDGRVGTRYLERGGAPRGTAVHDDRTDAAVTTATAEELSTGAIADAAVCYASGVTPARSETLARTTESLLETAAESGTHVAFDLDYRPDLWDPGRAQDVYEALFPSIDTLVLDQDDAERILGLDGDLVTFGHGLLTEFGFETVVITRDDMGAVGFQGGEVHEQPAIETDERERAGADEAFVGGFLARRIRGAGIADALAHGTATATLACTLDGDAAVVTPDEVTAVVEGSENLSR